MTRRLPTLSAVRQRGMSLVELMVGLAVGLMLVAGLAALFANASQSSSELEKSVRQIENGRYAVDLLAEDISMAGYFGEAMVADNARTATVSPCTNAAGVRAELQAMAVPASAALPFGIEGLTADEADALSCLANHLPGTPAVVVRRLDTKAVLPAAMAASTLYVQSSFFKGDVNPTFKASTAAGDMTLKNVAGTAPNVVRRYLSRVYYVASCSSDCPPDRPSDNIPTLKRAELRGSQVQVSSLAEGIEHVGFDYGFDANGDGAPDQWIGFSGAASGAAAAASAAGGWRNVVAVRIHVLARTTERTAGFIDDRTYSGGLDGTATFVISPASSPASYGVGFKRRDYTTTTRLNVIAGQRE
jgi:type IV pilus assembly protein PilW